MLYTVIRQFLYYMLLIFYRLDIRGRENIPKTGAVILCSNHISWWDPPLMGSLTSRKVRFMAKEELFKLPVLSYVMPRVLAFPVKRDTADRRAITTALQILKDQGVLGIFPEGTRSKNDDLLPPQAGVGLIAIKSGAPLVPMAIIGRYRLFRRVKVRVGKPIRFTEYYGIKTQSRHLAEVAEIIMNEISHLRNND